jgi:hypothetical protein
MRIAPQRLLPFILYVRRARDVSLILRAIARGNCHVLKVVCTVCILQRRVINEDGLIAVLQPFDLAFADQVKDLCVLL